MSLAAWCALARPPHYAREIPRATTPTLRKRAAPRRLKAEGPKTRGCVHEAPGAAVGGIPPAGAELVMKGSNHVPPAHLPTTGSTGAPALTLCAVEILPARLSFLVLSTQARIMAEEGSSAPPRSSACLLPMASMGSRGWMRCPCDTGATWPNVGYLFI